MSRQIGRSDLMKTDLNWTIPSSEIENPWFNPKIVQVINQPRKNLQEVEDDVKVKISKSELK